MRRLICRPKWGSGADQRGGAWGPLQLSDAAFSLCEGRLGNLSGYRAQSQVGGVGRRERRGGGALESSSRRAIAGEARGFLMSCRSAYPSKYIHTTSAGCAECPTGRQNRRLLGGTVGPSILYHRRTCIWRVCATVSEELSRRPSKTLVLPRVSGRTSCHGWRN